jgi:hypothetical protein
MVLQQGLPLLAQAQEFGGDEAAIVSILVIAMLVGCAVGIAIQCLILFLLYNAYKAVPPQFQTIEPYQVWLLLIPCFNIIWNFFVYQRIPESYQRCMHALGRQDQGDCGQQLGLWYCICVCCSIIPYLGSIAALASLVLLILFLVKMYQLKGIIEQTGKAWPAAGTGQFYQAGDPSNPYANPGDGQSPFPPKSDGF